jgi:hypothetical protein
MKHMSVCALLLVFVPAAGWSQDARVRPRDSAADTPEKASPEEKARKKARTGPHGGVVVALGEYSGEFRLWSTNVELFVYDSAGAPVPTKGLKGTLEVQRFALASGSDPLRPEDRRNQLQPRGDRLVAKMALGRVVVADFRVDLEIGGVRREGTVTWRATDDRSRLGDWNQLPK